MSELQRLDSSQHSYVVRRQVRRPRSGSIVI
jgi:hypothetical protein